MIPTQNLPRFMDLILPARIRGGGELELARARQLSLISFSVGLLVLPFIYLRFFYFPPTGFAAWALVFGALILFVSPFIVKANESLSTALTFAGAGLAAVLIFYTQATGGLFAPSLLWYPLFPLLMAFYGGFRNGFLVIIILLLHLLYLYGYHLNSPVPVAMLGDKRYIAITVASSSVAFLLAFSFGVIADRMHRRAIAAAVEAEASVRAANASLERRIIERTRELAESELRYRALIDDSLQGIVVYREDEILFANQAEAAIFGFDDPQQMLETSFDDCISLDDRPRLREYRLAIQRGEPAVSHYEFCALRRDGSMIWIEVLEDAVPWQGGTAVQAAHFDITDRKTAEADRTKLEAQLRQAQKMEAIGQLAGGVAHDFNNLLQIVLGSAQLAMARRLDDVQRDGYLRSIVSAAQRGASLTQQLLAFSRRHAIRKREISLNAAVEEIAGMLGRVIEAPIEVVVNLRADVWPVNADPGLIGQVLMNLCLNARDAMTGQGQLRLETRNTILSDDYCRENIWARPGRYAEIVVSDTGIGISPEIRDHIFEPFFTTKEIGKGSGLGLSVVLGIIEQHDGLIVVESQTNQGTSIRMLLPYSAGSILHVDVAEPSVAHGGSETVLVAEDDSAVRNLVSNILRESGYKVLAASDGMEAIAMFDSHRENIDLVLIDAVMPRMNGKDVALRVKTSSPEVHVVFSSGYSGDVIDKDSLDACRATILRKPYTREQLLSEVRRVLDSPI